MILLLVWLLMRFWDMSVHNKSQHNKDKTRQSSNRECDLLHAKCFFGEDEVTRELINKINKCGASRRSSRSSSIISDCSTPTTTGPLGSYFEGTNNFLRGLLAKIPLSQLFYNNNNKGTREQQQLQRSGLSISQLLAEFGDPDVLRSELAFMGVSEDLLFNNNNHDDFQWSQEYSFDEEESTAGRDANLLVMSASYEDMAKHLDAHLAELDIESFRAEDINSILNLKSNMEFKSNSSLGCRRIDEMEEELLFSPTSGREGGGTGGDRYLSTDSLDHSAMAMMMDSSCRRTEDGEEEEDRDELMESIRVSTNCQANKENYTLAFKDDSYSGSTDSEESSKGSCSRKVSWNKLGNSSTNNNNYSDQSLDSSGSFVGGWNVHRRSTPTKETIQLQKSPLDREQQNINLVKMFMKQRTLSTSSSNDLPQSSGATTSPQNNSSRSIEEFNQSISSRYRKKSMNDSGKCSTLSQHALDEDDEEEEDHQQQKMHEEGRGLAHHHTRLLPADDDYQLDSLDVVQSSQPQAIMMSKQKPHQLQQEGLRDKRQSPGERQNSKSIQTSRFLDQPAQKLLVFPECKLPNLDFVHLEHEVMQSSQFVTGDQLNQLNGSHPHGFDHIVDWDSLLFLLSREHKEMLKRYPMLSERIRNSYQDSVSDVFDEFPETIEVNFDEKRMNVCDCDSLLSSTASNNSSNRYSSDSGLGPNNTYNFEDLRKLFVYEYNALDEESEGSSNKAQVRHKKEPKQQQQQPAERRYRERRYTMCSLQQVADAEELKKLETQQQEKRVSFGLPKKRNNKSTSSIPRLIARTTPIREKAKEQKAISKIPKLIKSPSKTNVTGKVA